MALRNYLLSHPVKVLLEVEVGDGAFADLEFGPGIVLDVVDAHLFAEAVAAHRDIGPVRGVVPAGRDE